MGKLYRVEYHSGEFISSKTGSYLEKAYFKATEKDFTGRKRAVQKEFGPEYIEDEVILKGYWISVGYHWVETLVPKWFFWTKVSRVEEPYYKYVKGTKAVWVRKDQLLTLSTPYVKNLSEAL